MSLKSNLKRLNTNLNSSYYSPVSYASIKNSMYEFRRSGHDVSAWNELDQPGHLYFKVVFHFWNGDGENAAGANHQGLLAPTWDWVPHTREKADSSSPIDNTEDIQDLASQSEFLDLYTKMVMSKRNGTEIDIIKEESSFDSKDVNSITQILEQKNYNKYTSAILSDSAYNYLVRNNELDRADKLKHFITLLSNISSYSPWYFAEINGLDGVLEKPFKSDTEYIKVEAPKSITIKCMPDSMDNRIATLLDLYKDVVYSHTWHRVILPSNLRKFDMSIYIFESPLANLHSYLNDTGLMSNSAREFNNNTPSYGLPVSYKRIELHDCEFEYNAAKSGYSALNNIEGFQQEFEIPIVVGDAYEYRYNVFIDREIGDMSAIDQVSQRYNNGKFGFIFNDAAQKTSKDIMDNLSHRLDAGRGGIDLMILIDDLSGNKPSKFINNQLLGNLHKGSITDIIHSSQRLASSAMHGSIKGVKNIWKDQKTKLKNGWTYADYTMNENTQSKPSFLSGTGIFKEHNIFKE